MTVSQRLTVNVDAVVTLVVDCPHTISFHQLNADVSFSLSSFTVSQTRFCILSSSSRFTPCFVSCFQMLAMHLPKAAVAMKMSAEGKDPAVLDLDPDGEMSLKG